MRCLFIIGERESENCSVVPNSLRPHRLYPLWNSPGQNTGAGNLSLLHWIFLTQESNQDLLHCRWILYQLIYEGSYDGSHHRDWNARVGSQEIPGITVWPWITKWSRTKANRVLPRENTCHSKHPLPATREDYTWTSPDGQHWNQIDYIHCSQRWRSSIQSTKTRPELTVAQIMNSFWPNSELNWRK